MKKVAILGSTGSIGVNALDVISKMPDDLSVAGLAAHSNAELLFKQAKKFRPSLVSLFDPKASEEFQGRLNGSSRYLSSGVEGLVQMASDPEVDIVLTSLVGGVGFAPLLAAIRAGKTIALANKEPMVMAGAQFMKEAERWEAKIIPVDSEPSAIFQCVQGEWDRRGASPDVPASSGAKGEPASRGRKEPFSKIIRRVFLTASGGAFYRRKGSLDKVSVDEALHHPTWKMGKKITLDCATLMNKGFESIEIMNLFGLNYSQIEILIHHQSIIHSAVEFTDGSVLAQMSLPDMRLPIEYAMTYPKRGMRVVKPLNLAEIGSLTFDKPDFRRFPCLELASEAARKGGGLEAVLNAADEIALEAFMRKKIKFTDIPRLIEKTMKKFKPKGSLPSLSEIVEIDQWARQKAEEIVSRL